MPERDSAPGRLFQPLGEMSTNSLADNLYAAAYGLEEALLAGGATPGADYTRVELLRVVQPFVLAHAEGRLAHDLVWHFPEHGG